MPVLQKMSIRFFKQFPTSMHSGKIYIRHLFRNRGLAQLLYTKLTVNNISSSFNDRFLRLTTKISMTSKYINVFIEIRTLIKSIRKQINITLKNSWQIVISDGTHSCYTFYQNCYKKVRNIFLAKQNMLCTRLLRKP